MCLAYISIQRRDPHNLKGSNATQRNRERILTLIANELNALGYRQMQARSLKPKYIEALVKQWQERDLSKWVDFPGLWLGLLETDESTSIFARLKNFDSS